MQPSLSLLTGKTISHVWCGDYSALYLEIGELFEGRAYGNGAAGNLCGEITLYAGFDWRFDGPWSAFASDALSAGRRKVVISSLLGATISSAGLSSGGVELTIATSTGVRLVTHSPTPLNPNWSVSFNAQNPGHMYIQNGLLRVERSGY
jgi:hypothetical protein